MTFSELTARNRIDLMQISSSPYNSNYDLLPSMTLPTAHLTQARLQTTAHLAQARLYLRAFMGIRMTICANRALCHLWPGQT